MRVAILDNLRSAFNVGSVFRTCAALGYTEVALCGVTMRPPSPKLSETSRGADELVAWQFFPETIQAIEHYRAMGCVLTALEKCAQAADISTLLPQARRAWILGNEAHGIAEHVLAAADEIISLPVKSRQSSINVCCAFAAAAYVEALALVPS